MGPEQKFIPKWIAWETTEKCNLQCIHCRCSSDLSAPSGDFTTEGALGMLDDIASYCKPVVVLSGGEPLLRKDIFEIAKHGTEVGLKMAMATNGVLVNDKRVAKMKDAGIRICSLSLDGSTAEIHDDFRQQKGAFKAVMRAAECFRRNNMDFLINSSFTRRNQHDIENVYRLAKKTGAMAWYMFMIVPTGRGEDILSELITKEDYEEILKWHYRTEQNEEDILMRPTCAPHYYRITLQEAKKEGKNYERRNLTFSTGGNKGCIAAQSICFIDCFGNVNPCSYFPVSAGNIKKTPFKEIWENSPLFNDLRSFEKYKGKCGKCEYINVCGGCRARARVIYGDYLAEEPFCSYRPASNQGSGVKECLSG
ncbi:MAG: radical SAM protein [Desulfobacterales bacterium]|nr:radical SAM protein [Desulfobacterales bacterium]